MGGCQRAEQIEEPPMRRDYDATELSLLRQGRDEQAKLRWHARHGTVMVEARGGS